MKEIVMICPHCREWRICDVMISEPGEGIHFGDPHYVAAANEYPVYRVVACRRMKDK